MEDQKSNAIAILSIIALIIATVAARLVLGLSKAFYLIAGAGGAAILAVLAYVISRRRINRRRELRETQLVSDCRELRVEYSFLRRVAGVPTKFRYSVIEEATDNFRSLLGQGASASVFKGVLSDGTAVAVKRIERGGGGEDDDQSQSEKEFRSEVAAIGGVHHVNLVRLLGYCAPPGRPKFLIYDFIHNGSLDSWIFPKKTLAPNPTPNPHSEYLNWNQRYRVAIDVAKGLSYLHHDCRSRILHLDVKPENILLDENFRAIVSDFGLSKLMKKDQSRVVTTVRGTRGYLAPEWLLQNGVSEKSDVYSYGMVLLEMLGGRRNVCLVDDDGGNETKSERRRKRRWEYFPKTVSEKMREGKLMEVVDPRLFSRGGEKMAVDEGEVRRLVYVALWCVQEKARLRPSMSRVVEMLESRTAVEEPPDTQMIIVDLLSIGEGAAAVGGNGPPLKMAAKITTTRQVAVEGSSTSVCSIAMSAISAR